MCESKQPEVLPLCRVSPSIKLTAIVQLCNRNLLGQRLSRTSGRYPGVTPMFIPGSLEGFFLCRWLKLSQLFYLGRQRFCIPSQMFLLFKNEDSYAVRDYKSQRNAAEHRDLQVDMGIRLQLHILLSNAEPTNRILCKVGPVPFGNRLLHQNAREHRPSIPAEVRQHCSHPLRNALVHKYYIPLGKIINHIQIRMYHSYFNFDLDSLHLHNHTFPAVPQRRMNFCVVAF